MGWFPNYVDKAIDKRRDEVVKRVEKRTVNYGNDPWLLNDNTPAASTDVQRHLDYYKRIEEEKSVTSSLTSFWMVWRMVPEVE